jgi:quinol monooxygenase YgiN
MNSSKSKAALVTHGTFLIHPDDTTAFAGIVRSHVLASQSQPGCLYYSFAVDVNDANLFHIFEGWSDSAALDRHNKGDDMQKTQAQIKALVRVKERDATVYTVADQAPMPSPQD